MIHLTEPTLLNCSHAWATFSDDMRYRFTLGRVWDVGPLCNGLFMNPSTADHLQLDSTTERFKRRCQKLGFGGFIVTNINAFVETKQDEIRKVDDPVGEGNDDAIIESASQCQMVLCGWGANRWSIDRANYVRDLIMKFCPRKVHCLKLTKNGHPQHHLYISYDQQPVPWSVS